MFSLPSLLLMFGFLFCTADGFHLLAQVLGILLDGVTVTQFFSQPTQFFRQGLDLPAEIGFVQTVGGIGTQLVERLPFGNQLVHLGGDLLPFLVEIIRGLEMILPEELCLLLIPFKGPKILP